MKSYKVLSLILTAMMFMLSIGCSNSASNNPAASESPASASTAEPDAPSSNLEGSVVFWSMWSDTEPQAKVIQGAVEQFKKANPNVTVDLKFTGRDLNKLIKPALDGGQQIDIFEGDPAVTMDTVKDHLLKLDEYLSEPAVGMEGKTVQESILPSLMDWTKSLSVKAGLEEGFYALPQQPFAVLFFYNKEVYEKAGITSPPATWEQFMEYNERIKQAGVAPITFDDAYRDLFIGGYLSSAMGNEWVDQLVNDKTGEMWKDPIVLQFAKDMLLMKENGYFSTKLAGSKYPAAQQDLVLGQSAAYLNGTWLPNEVAATAGPDFKWGSFQFPTVPNGNGKGGTQELTFGAQALMLNKNSSNKAAAIELVKYLIGKNAQSEMVKQAQAIPATVDTEWPPALAEAAVAIDNAKINAPWGFGINNSADFSKGMIVPVFMELVTGKLSADDYVNKMSSEAKKFYGSN
ncbi:extracellular solute-binding protein [Paenibacillus sp. LHD-38]|uniref:ABC transporter substrate-binding protein n=1 Tax=Paenibacillus sp. LHD-38 TaxID=3072143 RepID=UPI00280D1D6D|nr:extracellular solute-binding protein [Paenibacillus sp. LHD-38]MDQ8735144.1 extracellular solute-binding protein [Paenibacillus sp. LHD-38]